MNSEIHQRLAVLRQKSRDNTLTMEEIRESITLMREGRVQAAATSATSKARTSTAKAKKAPIDSNDLLSELDGLGL